MCAHRGLPGQWLESSSPPGGGAPARPHPHSLLLPRRFGSESEDAWARAELSAENHLGEENKGTHRKGHGTGQSRNAPSH